MGITYHSLEDTIFVRVVARVHDTRAVDQENTAEERDVLPHLGLPGRRRGVADPLGPQRVDDRALSDVRVPYKAYTALLPVLVKRSELTEELNQRAFAERICDACMESQRGVLTGENADPTSL